MFVLGRTDGSKPFLELGVKLSVQRESESLSCIYLTESSGAKRLFLGRGAQAYRLLVAQRSLSACFWLLNTPFFAL